jgi:hypothetical protein
LEWLPQWNYPYVYWQCAYICLIISALTINFYYIFKKNSRQKLNLWQIGIVIGFAILAIKSRRHFPLMFIITAPWLLNFITDFFEIKATKFHYLKNKTINVLINVFLVGCFIIVPLNILVTTNFVPNPFNSFCENQYSPNQKSFIFPCQAIEIMKSNPAYRDLKLFSNFGWGGFLIWNWPEKQLFIDGRMPQADYEGRSLLEEYWDFFNDDQSEFYLNKHQIKMVLLYDSSRLTKLNWLEKKFLFMNEADFNKKGPLKEYLDNSPEWKLIYSDDISKIYVRQ